MSDEPSTTALLLEEIRLLRGELAVIRADLAARKVEEQTRQVIQQAIPQAVQPRVEPYTVKEFSTLIRRGRMFVSDRCRAGIIKTLPGRSYRIPVGELKRWTERAA